VVALETWGTYTIPLRLTVRNGEFDIRQVRSQLPFPVRAVVGLDVNPTTGMFEVSVLGFSQFQAPVEHADLPRAAAKFTEVPVPEGPDYIRLDEPQYVKLSIFYNGKPVGDSGGESPIRDIQVNDIDVHLSLAGLSAISFGSRGKIVLGGPDKDGVVNFSV